jgi:hypothetical protein
MVDDIVLGIAEKVRTVYAQEDYKLYTESIEQGFKEPCFFVQLITQEQTQRLGNRYREVYSFDVMYFPTENGNENEESHNVSAELYELLEYITVNGDLIRGIKLNSRVQEKVLHFFVDYPISIVREKAVEENMEGVIVYGETKDW